MPIQVPAPVLRAVSLGWLAFALAGCDTGSSEPDPVVYFELDAPLCSSVIPVQFQVDGSEVGVDTFRVNLPPIISGPGRLSSSPVTMCWGPPSPVASSGPTRRST